MNFIAALSMDWSQARPGLSEFQLAKADRIPVCDSFVASAFQCLHFDYGLPILTRPGQSVYGIAALFMPPEAISSGTLTRIVRLNSMKRMRVRCRKDIVQGLRSYAVAYGDGWSSPEPVNTGRISIWLRFLDAVAQQRRFASLFDADSANFILHDDSVAHASQK